VALSQVWKPLFRIRSRCWHSYRPSSSLALKTSGSQQLSLLWQSQWQQYCMLASYVTGEDTCYIPPNALTVTNASSSASGTIRVFRCKKEIMRKRVTITFKPACVHRLYIAKAISKAIYPLTKTKGKNHRCLSSSAANGYIRCQTPIPYQNHTSTLFTKKSPYQTERTQLSSKTPQPIPSHPTRVLPQQKETIKQPSQTNHLAIAHPHSAFHFDTSRSPTYTSR
jgi:hypothetical protein